MRKAMEVLWENQVQLLIPEADNSPCGECENCGDPATEVIVHNDISRHFCDQCASWFVEDIQSQVGENH
jgi:hypothetical protein